MDGSQQCHPLNQTMPTGRPVSSLSTDVDDIVRQVTTVCVKFNQAMLLQMQQMLSQQVEQLVVKQLAQSMPTMTLPMYMPPPVQMSHPSANGRRVQLSVSHATTIHVISKNACGGNIEGGVSGEVCAVPRLPLETQHVGVTDARAVIDTDVDSIMLPAAVAAAMAKQFKNENANTNTTRQVNGYVFPQAHGVYNSVHNGLGHGVAIADGFRIVSADDDDSDDDADDNSSTESLRSLTPLPSPTPSSVLEREQVKLEPIGAMQSAAVDSMMNESKTTLSKKKKSRKSERKKRKKKKRKHKHKKKHNSKSGKNNDAAGDEKGNKLEKQKFVETYKFGYDADADRVNGVGDMDDDKENRASDMSAHVGNGKTKKSSVSVSSTVSSTEVFPEGSHSTGGEEMMEYNRKCEWCGEQFTSLRKLTQHVRKSHKGEKPYKCKFCDKRFTSTWGVTRHRRSMHKVGNANKLEQYKCAVCGRQFGDGWHMKRHGKKHEQKTCRARPYHCDCCQYSFRTRQRRDWHLRQQEDAEELLAV